MMMVVVRSWWNIILYHISSRCWLIQSEHWTCVCSVQIAFRWLDIFRFLSFILYFHPYWSSVSLFAFSHNALSSFFSLLLLSFSAAIPHNLQSDWSNNGIKEYIENEQPFIRMKCHQTKWVRLFQTLFSIHRFVYFYINTSARMCVCIPRFSSFDFRGKSVEKTHQSPKMNIEFASEPKFWRGTNTLCARTIRLV